MCLLAHDILKIVFISYVLDYEQNLFLVSLLLVILLVDGTMIIGSFPHYWIGYSATEKMLG